MVLTGCLTMEEAYNAVDWKMSFLLAGVIPLGVAMEWTGAARVLVDAVLGVAGDGGAWGVLAGLYLVSSTLTSFMSNNATAILLAPIAISTAARWGVSAKPFLMAITFAASASFSTPVGYQTNALSYGPGGYRLVLGLFAHGGRRTVGAGSRPRSSRSGLG
jgi:di/tricarboxylate transporter